MTTKIRDASRRRKKSSSDRKSTASRAPLRARRKNVPGSILKEDVFRLIYDNSPIGIELFDEDGYVINVNKAGLAHFGVSEIRKLKGFSFFDDPMFPEEMKEKLRRGNTVRYEAVFDFDEARELGLFNTAKTGTISLDLMYTPIRTEKGGKIKGYLAQVQDVSERRKNEDALRVSEERFRRAFENAAVGASMASMKGQFIKVNKFLCNMLGYTEEELTSKTFSEVTHPDDVEIGLDAGRKLVSGEINYTAFEKRYMRKNGQLINVIISPTIIRDNEGKPLHFFALFQDITERKNAEEDLKKSEEKFRTLFESANDAILLAEAETGGILDANRKAEELFGMSADKLIGLHHTQLHPAELAEEYRRGFLASNAKEGVVLPEMVITGKDGRRVPVEISQSTIQLKGKQVRLGIFRDITERKEAEEKIRQSETFARNILDSVDEGFIVVNRDYRILTANKAYCRQAGLPCDKVIGRHCFEISHKAARPCYEEGEDCAVHHVLTTGEMHTALHKHTDDEGHVIYVETKAFPVMDAAGNVTSAIETITNITEKHLLEEERLKTQKLESIGTLAGGIAHDFNNLLQGVFGYISMAKMTVDQKERSRSMLEQAEKALHMSVNLTSQLLTFSKGGNPVTKSISLTPVIENAVRFALSGSNTGYRIMSSPDLWYGEADEGQFGQVIQNIVLNADQAMPLGGTIEIRARNFTKQDPGAPQALKQGDYVEIAIKDSGLGIPEHFLPRIFDPYFTTKEKGSGLGLATSYSIISNHGGMIDVRSEVGKGSTFLIYLPSAGVGAVAVVSPPPASVGRPGRILVMDDEDVVRMVSGEMLRSLGHDVEFAEHGADALEKYEHARAEGRPFDVVILDLTIRGGMGGEETVKKLNAIDPSVKAVVSSGYSDDAIVANYREHGFSAFLKKPYDADSLRDVLNSLLT